MEHGEAVQCDFKSVRRQYDVCSVASKWSWYNVRGTVIKTLLWTDSVLSRPFAHALKIRKASHLYVLDFVRRYPVVHVFSPAI
jgi:hypothetical protein